VANEIFHGVVKFMEIVRLMVIVINEIFSGFHLCEDRVYRQCFVNSLFCYNSW